MNCKNCGKHIPNDSNFCQYCRIQVKEGTLLPEKITSAGITCPQCGSHNLQVVAEVTGKGIDGKKMCLGSSAITSSCCGLSSLAGIPAAILGSIGTACVCPPSLLFTIPTTLLTGLGCAQLSATTGAAGGAAIGMHRAGETRTEHFWICKHCGQKFKV